MIEIKNVSKAFYTPRGIKTVLSDFNLLIKDGVFLGITGKSGAGKSTLLSIISGLQKPDAGSVFIDGIDLTSLSDREVCAFRNKNIGFVSQEQSFLENLTVMDNVILPCFLSRMEGVKEKDVIARAKEILSDLEIEELSEMYPSYLSGGENHRVLIARALINDPKIIVADEPTDSLDAELAESIMKIFHSLADNGKIVIVVSHDKDIMRLCDDCVFIGK